MPTDRQKDIDIAKGIGIIMVVWAHAHGSFINYIEQFHMPFFFFISGLLYTNKTFNYAGGGYFAHKFKSLILPFWQWNILFFPVFYILYYWKNWSLNIFIKGLINILLTLDKVPFLGATWFLPALFWVSISVHILAGLFKNYKFSDIYILGLGILACLIGFYVTFPYRLSRTLICGFFYVCGYLYNKHLRTSIRNNIKNISAIICGITYIFIVNHNSVSMGANQYEHKLAFVIGALMATVFVLRISSWLSTIKIANHLSNHLAYLGKNSMGIVIWQFLAFRVTIIIQILTIDIDLNAITAFPVYDSSGLWWILYLLSGIYVSIFWQQILIYKISNKR